MQKEIDRFNRAFIGMAADYVESLEAKVKGNATYSTEPQAIFRLGTSLADEVRVANVLAVTIRRMQDAQGGELPVWEPDGAAGKDSAQTAAGPQSAPGGVWELMREILAGKRHAPEGAVFNVTIDTARNPLEIEPGLKLEAAGTARSVAVTMKDGKTIKLDNPEEAYRLADSIEKMTARVWPGAKTNRPAPQDGSEYSIAPLYAPLYAPGRILIVPKSDNGIALDSIKEAEDFIDHIQKMMAKVWCYNK